MGIIGKQAIRGSIISYIGAAIAFVTVALIWPKVLSESEIGLLNILVAVSAIFAQFGSLGFINVINKYFTFYRTEDNTHRGFLKLAIVVSFIGFLLATILFLLLKTYFLKRDLANTDLLSDYYLFIIPLIFFTVFFEVFDNYSKVLYDAVIGTILKEIVVRVLNLVIIILYFFSLISLSNFVFLYVACLSLPSVLLLFILSSRGQIVFSTFSITKLELKKMVPLAAYSIIGGFGVIAVMNIDKIMVNKMTDLYHTGIYSTSFLFGSMILLPARALGKISSVLISDAFKNGDLKTISIIYKKSCLNQLIIAGILFLLLWINIDDILSFLPENYRQGKYVVMFIAISSLIEMATGVNGSIIAISDYFKYQWYFVIALLVLIVFTNLLLIPIWGITGAAIASAISVFIYNSARFLFLLIKFKMQPFDFRVLIIILLSILILIIFHFVPFYFSDIALISIALKSIICLLLYGTPFLFFKLSEELSWTNLKAMLYALGTRYLN